MRVKRGVTTKKKHSKVLKKTKGMQRAPRKSIRLGKQAVTRSLQYSYRDRRNKKRDFRQLWITRINAAAVENDTSYSQLMSAIKSKDVRLNRKILSELAANEPETFTAIVKFVQK